MVNTPTVLVFVDQTIHNTNLKDPRIDRSRVRLSLVYANGE
jgi:Mce-associated membrane protein